MRKIFLYVIIMISSFLTSCKSTTLTEPEAEQLVISAMQLPLNYTASVGLGCYGDTKSLDALQNDGLITYFIDENDYGANRLHLTPTNNAAESYKGRDKIVNCPFGNQYQNYIFEIFDYNFEKLTGISVDKETKTAIVRFTINQISITSVGTSLYQINRLGYPFFKPVNCELVFKKFDQGWQLESNQGRTGYELVEMFLKANNLK